MQKIRLLLYPFSILYQFITTFRTFLYQKKIFPSKQYNIPMLAVGNLSVGGTGKSPLVNHLIEHFYKEYSITTLSRGYGRKTKGYIEADTSTSANDIGDEPLQFYTRYGTSIRVVVCEKRAEGVEKIIQHNPPTDLIILDDAYQHLALNAQFYILLTTYQNPFFNDYVLPAGNLRERRKGASRAKWIIVTKCPQTITPEEKEVFKQKIKRYSKAQVCFSSIIYDTILYNQNKTLSINEIKNSTINVLTGIANADDFIHYLKQISTIDIHFEYKDHHNFSSQEIEKIALSSKNKIIITTEKDYMRLKNEKLLQDNLFFLPIKIIFDNNNFIKNIETYVKQF